MDQKTPKAPIRGHSGSATTSLVFPLPASPLFAPESDSSHCSLWLSCPFRFVKPINRSTVSVCSKKATNRVNFEPPRSVEGAEAAFDRFRSSAARFAKTSHDNFSSATRTHASLPSGHITPALLTDDTEFTYLDATQVSSLKLKHILWSRPCTPPTVLSLSCLFFYKPR